VEPVLTEEEEEKGKIKRIFEIFRPLFSRREEIACIITY